jgi:mycothiol synthase
MPTGNPPAGTSIEVSGAVSDGQAAAALELAQRAAAEDGVAPLSEQVMLHLRYGGDRQAANLFLWRDGQLAGYGHLDPPDPADPAAGRSGELIVEPASRRHGLGLLLLRALTAEAGDHGLLVWAHGDLPSASRLAAAAGFERTRSLWQMRRPLQGELAEPRLAAGVTVRTFRLGRDEDAWIELNHKAFAHHPEQGGWTRADLEVREREPWFDPAGFFLAERDGRLVGFHWTKVHGADEVTGEGGAPGDAAPGDAAPGDAAQGDAAPADAEPADAREGRKHEPIGEVYVVGVDEGERGTGLGRALTLVGLRHLRDRGLAQVMLYVDESNTPAIRLYESLGFGHWGTDVMFTGKAGGTPG